MELTLKTVSLPKAFIKLLKHSYGSERECIEDVLKGFDEDPSMKAIFYNSLSFAEKTQHFPTLIQGLGFNHIRDRLATLYLNKISYGKFLTDVDSSVLNDILFLESKVEAYAPHASSRHYLFGFYLEMHNAFYPEVPIRLPERVIELVFNTTKKTLNLDYVLLLLLNFSTYLPASRIDQLVDAKKIKLEDFFNELEEKDKRKVLSNLLEYTFAINEPNILLQETI